MRTDSTNLSSQFIQEAKNIISANFGDNYVYKSVRTFKNKVFGKILYRQIAGALARRIVNYAKVGDLAEQGKDAGFIKFGSRVDLFLPIGTKLNVKLNQKVKGGITVIASKD